MPRIFSLRVERLRNHWDRVILNHWDLSNTQIFNCLLQTGYGGLENMFKELSYKPAGDRSFSL